MEDSIFKAIKTQRNRTDFALLWAWIILTVSVAIKSLLSPSCDFRGYYAAARVLVSGGNPYDYGQVAPVLLSVTGYMGNNQFFYPLWLAWFFAPLSFMPFQIARCTWMIFNLGVWIVSLWQLSVIFGWPARGWRRWFMFLITTWIFAFQTFMFEQIGIILFGLLTAAITAVRKQQWYLAGILLGLLLIKPNVTLIPVTAIAVWLARRNQLRPLTVMCIFIAGLFIVTTIATPDWYRPFFGSGFGHSLFYDIDGPGRTTGLRINTTLIDWLKYMNIGLHARNVIYLTSLISGLLFLTIFVLRSESLITVIIVSMLVNYGVTPYALQYDYPPLVLVLFWATALHSDSKQVLIGKITMIVFMASVIFWGSLISDGYWILIGLSVLAIWTRWQVGTRPIPQSLL